MIDGCGDLFWEWRVSVFKLYDKYFVYVPSEVARDSNFPFKSGDEVIVRIDPENKCLVIKKYAEKS